MNREECIKIISEARAKGKRPYLGCADLIGADLSGADLSRSNLSGADLIGVDLSGADLSRSNLSGADLSRSNLSGADLIGADLSGADLSRSNLSGADLSRSNLIGADLSRSNLIGADLSGADLSRSNLIGASLIGADLSRADLSKADLSKADLSKADLSKADLSWANLSGTIGASLALAMASHLPSHGQITGWKKLAGGLIAELIIPASAKRSHGASRKCRASAAEVKAIYDLAGQSVTEGVSILSSNFVYRVGETVEPREPFCEDRWSDCASGIHFFITKEEAENYEY